MAARFVPRHPLRRRRETPSAFVPWARWTSTRSCATKRPASCARQQRDGGGRTLQISAPPAPQLCRPRGHGPPSLTVGSRSAGARVFATFPAIRRPCLWRCRVVGPRTSAAPTRRLDRGRNRQRPQLTGVTLAKAVRSLANAADRSLSQQSLRSLRPVRGWRLDGPSGPPRIGNYVMAGMHPTKPHALEAKERREPCTPRL